MSRRHGVRLDVANVDELANLFIAILPGFDLGDPRWEAGWRLHRPEVMNRSLTELRAKTYQWWGRRPWPYWAFDVGVLEPLDDRERLRLLVEHDELRPFEAERIRRLSAEAVERIGSEREQHSERPGVGPDADAVALGELLDELTG